jgi:replicative DNA helicase
LIELAEKRIFDISQQREKRDFSHMKDIVLDVFNLLEERASHDGSMTGLTTGFEDIDRMTAGLQKSDFILIAARPSMGKTAFALNLALNAAVRDSANVAIFSLEMAKEQLVQRIVSMESLVESNKLRSGELEGDDWDNIYIDDTPGITLFEVQSKCRRLSAQNGLDLVVIDYLQLMEGEGKSESRQQEISSLSRGLKGLAREMSCPVISLSQLSRAPEQRQDHRPILSDLRESGAIEQDADVVMFLYRDEYYHEDSEKRGIAEVKIAKHRNGPTGTVELAWVERFTKFANRPK